MGRKTAAYTGPFLIFMLFLGLSGSLDSAHVTLAGLAPIYVIFPVQTLVCAGILVFFWREYQLTLPRKPWIAITIGLLVLAAWIAPQFIIHRARRLNGFNPTLFASQPALYNMELAFRFLRLVIVVPLIEEIFWRGFLLRYLVSDDFLATPFGTYASRPDVLVAFGFMLEHSYADYIPALVAGFLYNQVAYRTKSLSSCVLAHSATNALLGAYIMITHQWGFW